MADSIPDSSPETPGGGGGDGWMGRGGNPSRDFFLCRHHTEGFHRCRVQKSFYIFMSN